MKALSLVLLAGAAGAAPMAAQDFELNRQLAPGSRFALRNIIGDIRVEASAGRRLEVTAVKREGRQGDPRDVEIEARDLPGGGVAVCVWYPGQSNDSRRGRERDRDDRDDRAEREDRDDRDDRSRRRADDPCRREGNWGGNSRNDTRVEFTVRVPAGLDLDIHSVVGDVFGRGLRGRSLDLGTVSGELELTDAQGETLDARSVSGDVRLDQVAVREMSAQTVSGDVTFAGPIDGRGEYNFETLSGDVTLTVPREPDAKVTASTFSGRFDSDFPVNRDSRRRRNRFSGSWGNGSAVIDLQSFSGDIRVRSSR
ncbi:MAG: DUF4097 domain-containing protein [Gemmatimonadales bacterium]